MDTKDLRYNWCSKYDVNSILKRPANLPVANAWTMNAEYVLWLESIAIEFMNNQKFDEEIIDF